MMWQIFQILLTLVVIGAFAEKVCDVRKTSSCDCLNPFYVDKPQNLSQCYPRAQFQNQVSTNFNRVFIELMIRGFGKKCDSSEYVKQLNEMRAKILDIVDAFYACTEDDCTDSISKAITDYVTFRKDFAIFTRSTVTNYSPECSLLVFEVRPLTFSSAENIISSITQCAKLKSQQSTGKASRSVVLKRADRDCNCVQISSRPLPKNEAECFSQEFISKMRTFIKESWKYINNAYENSNSECDYSDFLPFYSAFESASNGVIDLLQKPDGKLADLDSSFDLYRANVLKYSPAVLNYILNNEKKCYFVPRRVRTYPLSISDWCFSVAMKCLAYRG